MGRAASAIGKPLLVLPLALLMLVFLHGCAGLLVQAFQSNDAFSLRQFTSFLSRADYVRAFWLTHLVAAQVTLISLLIAYPMAHVMARAPRSLTWLLPLTLAPWMASVVVRTFGWMILLGPNGFINEALLWAGITSAPVKLVFNLTGVTIGLVQVFFPMAVFSIYNTLSRINWDVIEAASSLGVGPIRTFFRVVLPLASTGILNGASVIYLLSVGAVVTPVLLGGPSTQMLGTLIYTSIFTFFNVPRAAVAAVLLTVSALLVAGILGACDRFLNRHMLAERRAA